MKKGITDKTVAYNILKQLGGQRFIAMTGAKNLGCDENSLSMKIMRNVAKATHVKFTLEGSDTYTLTLYKCGKQFKKLKTLTGIYGYDLRAMFTEETGLYTNL